MTSSYTRACRSCGRRISLRQMPHGKWVAFENNEAHDCNRPPSIEVVRPPTRRPRELEAPDEFDEIIIPDNQQSPQPKPVLRPVVPPPSCPQRPAPVTPSPQPDLSYPE